MNNHLTDADIRVFWCRDADGAMTSRIAGHISGCEACRELAESGRRKKSHDAGMSFDLDDSIWLRNEHLEYEEKRAYASGLIGVEEREMTERHLASCVVCRDEMQAFVEDRRENDLMLSIRHKPSQIDVREATGLSWRTGGLWSPLRAAALILVVAGTGIVISRSEVWRRALEVLGTEGGAMALSIEGGGVATAIKPPATSGDPVTSGASHEGKGAVTAESRVTLRDHGHKVVVEPRITGLSGASDAELVAITEALVAEDIPLPEVVRNLWGSEGALRGERVDPFDLLRPRREVVRDTRPAFRWAALKDASSYQVFIVDSRRAAVVSSGRLGADVTNWRPSIALKRGEDYFWTVSATVHGEEVISPGPSEAEWKFGVLSEPEYQRLRRIEARTESHLARGVLYARAGLISESERELQKLLDENQDSATVRKLLKRVRSWR